MLDTLDFRVFFLDGTSRVLCLEFDPEDGAPDVRACMDEAYALASEFYGNVDFVTVEV